MLISIAKRYNISFPFFHIFMLLNTFLKETNDENFGLSYKSQFRRYSANTFRRDLVTKMDIYNSTFQSLQPSK